DDNDRRAAPSTPTDRRPWALAHSGPPLACRRYNRSPRMVRLMKRRLPHVLVALSAALCAWSLYAWGRSFWPEDLALRSYKGRLVVLATSGNFTRYNEKG